MFFFVQYRQETRNSVYGTTNNPHHTGRTAGGSSGAEAALTASCASVVSLCEFSPCLGQMF